MRALVIGASGGMGAALVGALSAQGEVVALSRSTDGLDVTGEASVMRVFDGISGQFDWVFIATGALGGGRRNRCKLCRLRRCWSNSR